MAGASGTEAVATVDGRRLTTAEWGDLEGFPVFLLHGNTPGSRFARHYDQGVYANVGARVITYDRPGYGGSDRLRGRRVVDCVTDVSAIADALGIQQFAVIGGSSGGPHSLAVAACLPERVTRAACASGVAPFDMLGLGFDWFAGMDATNIKEMGWALEGEDVLAREIEREAAAMLERVADDPANQVSDEVGLSEADRAVMAMPERREMIREMVTEAFRHGVWGYVDDTFSLIQPWGFDMAEIRVPTRVIYGLTDVLVPRQHGEWLADNVPNAEVVIEKHGGHLPDPKLVAERFGWLVQSS
jgi:pimeloyl-ACP methyl ester carboxylesterase